MLYIRCTRCTCIGESGSVVGELRLSSVDDAIGTVSPPMGTPRRRRTREPSVRYVDSVRLTEATRRTVSHSLCATLWEGGVEG